MLIIHTFSTVTLERSIHFLNSLMMMMVMMMMMMMMIMNYFVVWLTNERRLVLFPAGTIVRDPHYCKSLTLREQDLSLCRARVQA